LLHGEQVHGNTLLQDMRTSLRQGRLIDWFLDLCVREDAEAFLTTAVWKIPCRTDTLLTSVLGTGTQRRSSISRIQDYRKGSDLCLYIQPSNHPTIPPSLHPTIQPFNHPFLTPFLAPFLAPFLTPFLTPFLAPFLAPSAIPSIPAIPSFHHSFCLLDPEDLLPKAKGDPLWPPTRPAYFYLFQPLGDP
jgi:hypothetical protein